ncbi:hypothetical protein C6341_g9966 [Phytophthora cactorum]|nr:hypothetical protein C6341_g9966 [Phytophthora cactorum]KAG4053426.1 hypothetical protein PC123_g11435 [Phytophthora cactorum]
MDNWLKFMAQWVEVAIKESSSGRLTAKDFTQLLSQRRKDKSSYVSVHCGSCSRLARAQPSNTFQERVFSTGVFVMSSRRTSTDSLRAEMQVLMKHNNRTELCRMEATFSDVDHKATI